MSEFHFSKTYSEARCRFNEAATAVGATISTYLIEANCQDELAIDVAIVGPDNVPSIVTSSGVHGVEGFFGSAAQLAFLEWLKQTSSELNIRHVLIHGVNPFGFSCIRRFNEDNVDLNRNFLVNIDNYKGVSDGYVRLNGFLNPKSLASRFNFFKLKVIWNICRYGLQTLKQAIATGQYQYPLGIFFGGHGPCKSTQIVCENCDSWIGLSDKIVHIDFHSGLGAFGIYKLLLAEGATPETFSWYTDVFGTDCVELLDSPDATAYIVSGKFGEWLQKHFGKREYRFLEAEFGTFDIIRVLGAIRAENREHHYGVKNSLTYHSAKTELQECFCPSDKAWRKQVIESGLKIID